MRSSSRARRRATASRRRSTTCSRSRLWRRRRTCWRTARRRSSWPALSTIRRKRTQHSSASPLRACASYGRPSRWRAGSGARAFEREARAERSLGDLDLLRRRLLRRVAMLELVTRLRQRAGEPALGVPHHPAKELGRDREAAERRGRTGRAAVLSRYGGSDRVRRGRRDEQRPDQMRTATLVLTRAWLVVLVGADRDVLGAVVGGEIVAAQREQRGREGEQPGRELFRDGREAGAADDAHADGARQHRAHDPWLLERQLRLRQAPLQRRQDGDGLEQARRPTENRVLHRVTDQPLALGRNLDRSVGQTNRGRPCRGAVHEHAVLERHPPKAELLLGHTISVAAVPSREARPEAWPRRHRAGSPRRPARRRAAARALTKT